jgi:hypothetical protein
MKKDILAKSVNVKHKGKAVSFKSKMEQAADMIKAVQASYPKTVLAVTDSWLGNIQLICPLPRQKTKKSFVKTLCRVPEIFTIILV